MISLGSSTCKGTSSSSSSLINSLSEPLLKFSSLFNFSTIVLFILLTTGKFSSEFVSSICIVLVFQNFSLSDNFLLGLS